MDSPHSSNSHLMGLSYLKHLKMGNAFKFVPKAEELWSKVLLLLRFHLPVPDTHPTGDHFYCFLVFF